jgi:hypothetical protein
MSGANSHGLLSIAARFFHMMTNSPKKGVHRRDAGLQRAVLMPSSDWD